MNVSNTKRRRLDRWQVCQLDYPRVRGMNNWQLCLTIQQIQMQQMIAIVPNPKSNKDATTTDKCAGVTEQAQLQPKMAVVPKTKTEIDCYNHWQMCLSD